MLVTLLVTLTSMGAELQSQNRIDVNYEKTVSLGAWLCVRQGLLDGLFDP